MRVMKGAVQSKSPRFHTFNLDSPGFEGVSDAWLVMMTWFNRYSQLESQKCEEGFLVWCLQFLSFRINDGRSQVMHAFILIDTREWRGIFLVDGANEHTCM